MAGDKSVKTATLAPTDRYVYLGHEDPYCYIELTYDTWWLQSKGYKEHCVAEFTKMGCSYLSGSVVGTETEFLEVKNVEDCVGIRGSRKGKKHGESGWYRVLQSSPPVITPHGILNVVMKEDGYYQLHEMYKWYSLYLEGNNYRNAALENGTRRWIAQHWLLVTRAKSISELFAKLQMYEGSTAMFTHVLKTSRDKGMCTTLLNIKGENFSLHGDPATSSIEWNSDVTLSCGERLCSCKTVKMDFLQTRHPEHMTSIDREETWYEKAIHFLINTIWQTIVDVFWLILGDNWQGKLVTAGVSYYVTSQITNSVPAGVALAVVVLWNWLKE